MIATKSPYTDREVSLSLVVTYALKLLQELDKEKVEVKYEKKCNTMEVITQLVSCLSIRRRLFDSEVLKVYFSLCQLLS